MTNDTNNATQNAPAAVALDGLALLPEKTLLNELKLAELLQVHPRSVQRMVRRGELPPPLKLGVRRVWLAGRVLAHFETAAEKAAQAAEKERRRIAALLA